MRKSIVRPAAATLFGGLLVLSAPLIGGAQQNNSLSVVPAALPSGATAKVGNASEITNTVTGTLASLNRVLATGDSVHSKELITTASNADAKFQLLDDTTIAVGPNASITLDKFVVNPGREGADVAITALKGSFRFLSGTTPDTGYRITTPTSTVGIRGTEFEVFVDDNGETAIALISGEVEMCTRAQACERLADPGHYLRVLRNGRFVRARAALRSILGRRANAARAFPFLHGKRPLGQLFKRRRERIRQNRARLRQNRQQRIRTFRERRAQNRQNVRRKAQLNRQRVRQKRARQQRRLQRWRNGRN
ncbi:MAG: FecR domain-containing protein [Pseudomonadota bacterium]